MVTTTWRGRWKLAAMSPEAYPPGPWEADGNGEGKYVLWLSVEHVPWQDSVVPAPVHEAGLPRAGDEAGLPGETFLVVEPIPKLARDLRAATGAPRTSFRDD